MSEHGQIMTITGIRRAKNGLDLHLVTTEAGGQTSIKGCPTVVGDEMRNLFERLCYLLIAEGWS